MKNAIEHFEFTDTHSHIYVSEDHIIYLIFGRATSNLEENTQEAQWVESCYKAIKEKYGDEVTKILVDNTSVNDSEFNSDEANAIYKKLIKDEGITHIAVIIVSTGWYLFMEMFKFVAGGKLDIFHDRESAEEWLRSED